MFDDLPKLADICRAILTPRPLAVVLTAYSIRASFFAIHALMRDTFAGMGGRVESGELVIREKAAGRALSTSLFSRWVAHMSEHRPGAPGRVKEVTSLSNPLVKDLKALALKKFRDQQNAFIAEGLKLVIDALDLGWRVRTLVFAKSALGNPAVEKVAARTVAAGGDVLEVSEKILAADHPPRQPANGDRRIRADASQDSRDIRPAAGDVWVALDRVRDPGNLGTVLRTVDAVGAKGIILVGDDDRSFCHGNRQGDHGLDLRRAGGARHDGSVPRLAQGFFAASSPARIFKAPSTTAVSTTAARPVVLLMGNEQQGLPEALAETCDVLVRIPQAGRANSLNLAVATGVMLFEIRRPALKLRAEATR